MIAEYDVIIATYNGEKYISEQLDSILNQSVKPKNIILRDDCSIDNTFHILQKYSKVYSNIKIIKDNLKNLGYVKNFEKLCESVESELVFFSDQDDVWLDNKAETMLNAFEDYKNSAVFTNAYLVDSDLKNKGFLLPKTFDVIKSSNDILYRNFVTGCTLAVRKKALMSLLPFPDGIPHDYWIGANCALNKDIKYINTPLIKYRQHETNVIGIKNTSITAKINKLKYDSVLKRREFLIEKYKLVNHLLNRGTVTNISLHSTRNTLNSALSYRFGFNYLKPLRKSIGFKDFIIHLYDKLIIRVANIMSSVGYD
jgi:rhamnosyltransferase